MPEEVVGPLWNVFLAVNYTDSASCLLTTYAYIHRQQQLPASERPLLAITIVNTEIRDYPICRR